MEKRAKTQTFMQGVMALMFSQVLIKLLGLVYKIYITNKEGFGDAGNAIYGSGYQIYALLLTFSSIGLPAAIAKLISARLAVGDGKGAHRVFKVAICAFGLVGLMGTCVLFFGAHYISHVLLRIPEAELTLVALSPAVFFVSVSSIVRGYFNGRQNMKPTANSQTLEQVFKTFLTILFVELVFILSGANTELMAAGATIATALATFLSFGYLYIYYKIMRKQIWTELRGSVAYKPERIKNILKGILMVSIPISLTALLSTLNKNIDSFTVVRGLERFITDPERAKELYGILSGKVDTLTSLPLSFNVAFSISLVPAISALFAKKNIEAAGKRISFTILSTILLALPCTIGMILFAEPILQLVYPNQPEGTLPLQITSLTIITIALVQTINAALQGMGKIVVPAVALSIGVFAKLICNMVLIPIEGIGINGAAIGSVVCYVIADIIALIVLCKNIRLSFNFNKFVVKPILATLAMSIVSYGLYINIVGIVSPKIATVIALVVAVAIYGISIIMLKVFTNEEIEMFPYGNKINKFLKKTQKKKDFSNV